MTRMQFTIDAYQNGEIPQDVFGQFATRNFDTKVIIIAIERGWVSNEFAEKYINLNK